MNAFIICFAVVCCCSVVLVQSAPSCDCSVAKCDCNKVISCFNKKAGDAGCKKGEAEKFSKDEKDWFNGEIDKFMGSCLTDASRGGYKLKQGEVIRHNDYMACNKNFDTLVPYSMECLGDSGAFEECFDSCANAEFKAATGKCWEEFQEQFEGDRK